MPEKNVHLLIACVQAARQVDPNIVLVVLGAVVPRVPWDIETEASSVEFGVSMLELLTDSPGVVHITQGGDSLVDLTLEASDVAVTLSCNRDENFGLGIREAEQRGVPTIVTAWGGHLNDDHHKPARSFIPVFLSGWGTHVDQDSVVRELLAVERRHVDNPVLARRDEHVGLKGFPPLVQSVIGSDPSVDKGVKGSTLSRVSRQLKGGLGVTDGFATLRDIMDGRQSVYTRRDSHCISLLWEAYGGLRVAPPVADESRQLVAAFGLRNDLHSQTNIGRVYRDDFAWASSAEVRGPAIDILTRILKGPLKVAGSDRALVAASDQLIQEGFAYWRE